MKALGVITKAVRTNNEDWLFIDEAGLLWLPMEWAGMPAVKKPAAWLRYGDWVLAGGLILNRKSIHRASPSPTGRLSPRAQRTRLAGMARPDPGGRAAGFSYGPYR